MLKKPPVVHTQMLIRRPADEVFEAFADPAVTTQFWFTRSSGRLEVGARLRWDWDMYGVFTHLRVKALEPGRRILIEWDDPATPVEWRFVPQGEDATLVSISTSGFHGSDDDVVAQAIDAMGGFSLVLAGAKAWLEHRIRLNLVADRAPQEQAQSQAEPPA